MVIVQEYKLISGKQSGITMFPECLANFDVKMLKELPPQTNVKFNKPHFREDSNVNISSWLGTPRFPELNLKMYTVSLMMMMLEGDGLLPGNTP